MKSVVHYIFIYLNQIVSNLEYKCVIIFGLNLEILVIVDFAQNCVYFDEIILSLDEIIDLIILLILSKLITNDKYINKFRV